MVQVEEAEEDTAVVEATAVEVEDSVVAEVDMEVVVVVAVGTQAEVEDTVEVADTVETVADMEVVKVVKVVVKDTKVADSHMVEVDMTSSNKAVVEAAVVEDGKAIEFLFHCACAIHSAS